VATDDRLLLLDQKPLFVHSDEIIYDAISGVTYERVGFISTITVHTKAGDLKIRTYNKKCARSFVLAVEEQIYPPAEGSEL
jgi:hypothetical protein